MSAIRSRNCEDNYHDLCDGWYGHRTHPCECVCHDDEADLETNR